MNPAELRKLLEQVRTLQLPVDAALERLQAAPPEADLGFAHVDLQRRDRCGFPEVIFCEGKTSEWIEAVIQKLADAGQDCLATRVNAEQAAHLGERFPQARQDLVARTLWLPASAPGGASGGSPLSRPEPAIYLCARRSSPPRRSVAKQFC